MARARPDQLNCDWIRFVIPFRYENTGESIASRRGAKLETARAIDDVEDMLLKVVNFLSLHESVNTYEQLLELWTEAPYSLWSYDKQIVHDTFKIMFVDYHENAVAPVERLKMGVAVEISGQSCRTLEKRMGVYGQSWGAFFAKLHSEFDNVRVRRLDLAYDIFKKDYNVTPKRMYSRSKKRELQTKLKYTKFIDTTETATGKTAGQTFYIGKSPMQLRVYDKKLERINNHGDAFVKMPFWVRWEIELTDIRAEEVASRLAGGELMSDLYYDCLSEMMTVLPSSSERKHFPRADVSPWWESFIDKDNRNKLQYKRPVKDVNLDRTLSWIEKQVAPSMFRAILAHSLAGGDVQQLLIHWLEQGKLHTNEDDMSIINQFILQHYEDINARAYKSIGESTPFEVEATKDLFINEYEVGSAR